MVKIIACAAASLIFCVSATAQQQELVEFFNDYGDGTVQTFVSESDQTLFGVELSLLASGNGADVTVQIRDLLADGTLSDAVLASGVFPSDAIPQDLSLIHI